jgi:hypothetical protein
MLRKLFLAALALAALTPASAQAAFSGTLHLDAETGDLSQFAAVEVERGAATTTPYARVVSRAKDPVHVAQGRYSVVYYMPAHGKRIETPTSYAPARQFAEGQTVYIARQIFLDPHTWAEVGWNPGHHLTMQIKTADRSIGGPFGFDDRDDRWTCGDAGATQVISRSVTKGRWERWLYRFRFSSDPAKGHITVWRDGAEVFDTATRTLEPGYTAYYKQGIYQNTNVAAASRIWIDGTTISTSRAAAERGAWGAVKRRRHVSRSRNRH